MDNAEHKEVFDLIKRSPQASLATVNEGGGPELAHVIAFLSDDHKIYFLSKRNTRKMKNMLHNGLVSLLFSDTDALKQAECIGNATLVEDKGLYVSVFEEIQKTMKESIALHWAPPAAQVPGHDIVIVEVSPAQIVYRDYGPQGDNSGYREITVTP